LIRRNAVWALANLGDSQKRYQKLPDDQKAAVRQKLEEESKSGSDEQRSGAEAALAWLDGKSIGVIEALAKCATDERDMFLRVEVAHAHIFWEGTPEEQKIAEKTLLLLAADLGKGHDDRIAIEETE
jgi:TRAP-type C4-dicarboxylate transport system substrate-binding protein